MEAEFVGCVSDAVASSVGAGVRVAAFHDERLVIVLELADLFDLDAVLCAETKRRMFLIKFWFISTSDAKLTQT